jgi:HSP20 family molecular chaperone IbpA
MEGVKEPPVFAPGLYKHRVVRALDPADGWRDTPAIESFSYSLSECPWVPDLEVFEQGGRLIIQVDLPAMKLDELSVTVTDDRVTVSGDRRREAEAVRRDLHAPERVYGPFSRTVRLPDSIVASTVTWSFENGVLQIAFPIASDDAAAPAA